MSGKERFNEVKKDLAENVFEELEQGNPPYGPQGMGLEFNKENAELVLKFWIEYKKGNKEKAIELFDEPLTACLYGAGFSEDDDDWV